MDTIKNISLLGKMQSKTESLLKVISQLENNGGTIHAIETDLMKQKTLEIYELLLQFGTTNSLKTTHRMAIPDLEIQLGPTDLWEGLVEINQEEQEDGEQEDGDQEKEQQKEMKAQHEEIEAEIEEQPEEERDGTTNKIVDHAENAAEVFETVEDDFISVAETSKPVEPFSKLMPEPNETEAYTETSRLEEQQQAIHFREQAAAHFDLPPRVSKESQSATLSLFDDSESLADKLASPDNSIAARMTNSRINDLRQAIGINDKFLLINELFEGNISYYNKAIDELNSFQSLNGAKTYLIELSVLHQWDAETAAVSKMEQLIERKFGY